MKVTVTGNDNNDNDNNDNDNTDSGGNKKTTSTDRNGAIRIGRRYSNGW